LRTKRLLFGSPELRVYDVRCSGESHRDSAPEWQSIYGMVFPRAGSFVRTADGEKMVVDVATAYAHEPETEERFAHPSGEADVCTAVEVAEATMIEMLGGSDVVPLLPVFTSPEIDRTHRVLLRRATDGDDALELAEATIALIGSALETSAPESVGSGRPSTVTARRRIVDGARQRIAVDPSEFTLRGLASELAVSPYHLCHVFHQDTGSTLSGYRNRVRVRMALERLAAGERDLAALAADLGFADHAHFTRVVRRETGSPPSHLRVLLNQTNPG
jgi:AraC-like DNA-binding protein